MSKFDWSHIEPEVKYSGCSGRSLDGAGYIIIKKPSHPNAPANGYVKEHRLVMEVKLGRYLEPEEHVHHIDGNKQNNNPDNLQLTNRAEHRAIHNLQDKKYTRKFNVKVAEELYLKGHSTRAIAKMLGVGKTAICNFVLREGLSRPKYTARDKSGKFKRRVVVNG